MTIQTELIPYTDQGTLCEAFVAYKPDKKKRPLVILCHTWSGRDDFICSKAEEIAKWGYVGFALDIYGKGVIGKSKEENLILKKPFMDNRKFLHSRLMKAYEVSRSLPYVNDLQIIALGFGFGGLCALDLARIVNLKGAISVYGHLDFSPNFVQKIMHAKILVLHGYNDSIVTIDDISRFTKEMDDSKADWQMHLFGNTVHGFATPQANDAKGPIAYNPVSAHRAWKLIENFLSSSFDFI